MKISGRGAPNNIASKRFHLPERTDDGDWLDVRNEVDGEPAGIRTSVFIEKPKSIITRNSSPDLGFDRSINVWRGCEHGCIYCFARPTHAFHDLSPGLDFETKLFAKPDAPMLLRKELAAAGYRARPIAMGTNTDPYQPIEKDWRLTRECIAILRDCRHPLIVTTKSNRVVRDIDLLADMARDNLVAVAISVTSLDPAVARTLEPRAPHPAKRLDALRQLSDAGIPAHVNVAPVIPGITDHEMEHILESAAKAGARTASFIPIRLPYEVAPLFRAWLDKYYPDRKAKVMAIINDIRGGRDNDPDFGSRMRGRGIWAELLRTRFRKACARHGLNLGERIALNSSLFCPPEGDQPRLL